MVKIVIDIKVKEGKASRKKENEKKNPEVSRTRPLFPSLCPGEHQHVTDFWPSELISEEFLFRRQNTLVYISNPSLMTAKWFVGGYEKCPSPLPFLLPHDTVCAHLGCLLPDDDTFDSAKSEYVRRWVTPPPCWPSPAWGHRETAHWADETSDLWSSRSKSCLVYPIWLYRMCR